MYLKGVCVGRNQETFIKMGSQTSLSLTFYGICLLFPWHHLHLMLFSLLTAFAFLNISSFLWLPKHYWVYRANHSAAEHGRHLTSVHCLVFIPMLFPSYPAFPLLFTLFIWHEVLSPCRINTQFLWAFKLWSLLFGYSFIIFELQKPVGSLVPSVAFLFS